MRTFSTPQVVRLTGATYRQVDYCARMGIMRPAHDARGSGTVRRYSLREVLTMRAVFVLREMGLSYRRIRDVVVPELLDRAGWDCRVFVTPAAIVELGDADEVRHGWVLDLAEVHDHVIENLKAMDSALLVAAT